MSLFDKFLIDEIHYMSESSPWKLRLLNVSKLNVGTRVRVLGNLLRLKYFELTMMSPKSSKIFTISWTVRFFENLTNMTVFFILFSYSFSAGVVSTIVKAAWLVKKEELIEKTYS